MPDAEAQGMTTMESTRAGPKRVAFLGEDANRVKTVSEYLAPKGVEVLRYSDAVALCAGVRTASGTILVLDTAILGRDQDIGPLLDDIAERLGGRPLLVCIAHSKDIDLRLQALRAGTDAFLVEPVAAGDLAARLLELVGAIGPDSYRILVVDDQPVAALFAARVLEGAGMQTRIAGNALRVLEVLEEFRPDLVLMDLHMPGADGIELTTLIREHDELCDIPIIFLSSELDTDRQMDALRVGGNDFIAKPVRAERLVEAVQRGIRVSRKTQGRQQVKQERDGTTGLMSRSAFLTRLDSSIAREIEQAPGHGVLMIRIDLSDADADAVEQPEIDDIMGRLASSLRVRMRGSECAVRFSATRFAILARRHNEGALLWLAKALRAELESAASGDAIQVRIGIGRFHPPADDALTMISRAEKACSQACEGEGNDIGIFPPSLPNGSDAERDARLVELAEEALREQAFDLMYQPIVALRSAIGERYQTAVRLQTPDGEYIPASDFLPAAQRGGLVQAIDRWVMEHSLDRLKQERDAHQGLRFLVPQAMETLCADDWLSWFRDQIAGRDLIMQRPILQLEFDDLYANRELVADRLGALRRLAINTCLNLSEDVSQVLDLVGDLGVAMVRLPLQVVETLGPERFIDFIERVHEVGAKVIVARIEHPQSMAHVFACGVDFVQGNFLQLPSQDLNFDFSESALV